MVEFQFAKCSLSLIHVLAMTMSIGDKNWNNIYEHAIECVVIAFILEKLRVVNLEFETKITHRVFMQKL